MALSEFNNYINDNALNLWFTCDSHINMMLFWTLLWRAIQSLVKFLPLLIENCFLGIPNYMPVAAICSTPFGPYKWGNSKDAYYERECQTITTRLRQLGFPDWSIARGRIIADKTDRGTLLNSTRNSSRMKRSRHILMHDSTVTFVTVFFSLLCQYKL